MAEIELQDLLKLSETLDGISPEFFSIREDLCRVMDMVFYEQQAVYALQNVLDNTPHEFNAKSLMQKFHAHYQPMVVDFCVGIEREDFLRISVREYDALAFLYLQCASNFLNAFHRLSIKNRCELKRINSDFKEAFQNISNTNFIKKELGEMRSTLKSARAGSKQEYGMSLIFVLPLITVSVLILVSIYRSFKN